MSVLIKGMEMPTSCYECRFFVDTWCYAFKADDWRNAYNKPPKGERLNNCPLVPVPPHGRLIDADALDTSVLQAGFSYAITRRKLRYTPGEVREKIANAPTIIEAEGGK